MVKSIDDHHLRLSLCCLAHFVQYLKGSQTSSFAQILKCLASGTELHLLWFLDEEMQLVSCDTQQAGG